MKKLIGLILLLSQVLLAQYSGGSGTIEDPYLISTSADFNSIRTHVSSHFIVTNDIDMTGVSSFAPIGNFTTAFSGSIDGQHHTISNLGLTFLYNSVYHVGLFAQVTGTVKNIVFDSIKAEIGNTGLPSFNSSGTWRAGLFAGALLDATIDSVLFTNSNLFIGIRTSYIPTGWIGGFAGACSTSTITRCGLQGDSVWVWIAGSGLSGIPYIGGFIGSIYSSVVEESFLDISSKIFGAGRNYTRVYGFIGNLTGINKAKNCYVRGTGQITYYKYYSNPIITGFSNAIGDSDSLINIYTSIKLDSASTGSYYPTAGYCEPLTINTSSYVRMINCYYDKEVATVGQTYYVGHEGHWDAKTTSLMKIKSTYLDYDFENIWNIHPDVNGGYPFLRCLLSIPESAYRITIDGMRINGKIRLLKGRQQLRINK